MGRKGKCFPLLPIQPVPQVLSLLRYLGRGSLRERGPDGRDEFGIAERIDDEGRVSPAGLALEDRVGVGVRDDHGHARPLEAAEDREVQTVEVVEADVGNEQIRFDAVERLSRGLKRRRRHHGAAGVVQHRLGALEDLGVAVNEDDEGRHEDQRPMFMLCMASAAPTPPRATPSHIAALG
jgi:hypothetical protein